MTRRKINELIRENEWKFDEFPKIKQKLLEKLNIQDKLDSIQDKLNNLQEVHKQQLDNALKKQLEDIQKIQKIQKDSTQS